MGKNIHISISTEKTFHLSSNEILDYSTQNSKHLHVTQKKNLISEKVEDIEGKGENSG